MIEKHGVASPALLNSHYLGAGFTPKEGLYRCRVRRAGPSFTCSVVVSKLPGMHLRKPDMWPSCRSCTSGFQWFGTEVSAAQGLLLISGRILTK